MLSVVAESLEPGQAELYKMLWTYIHCLVHAVCCRGHGTLPLAPSRKFLWTHSLSSTCCLSQRSLRHFPWPHQAGSYEHIVWHMLLHRSWDIALGPINWSSRFLWTCSLPSTCCLLQRSWDIALGPIKQVPMNMFIMWMAGSSISIFPIMMVGMMFFRPIQAILAIQNSKCDCVWHVCVLTMCVTVCVCLLLVLLCFCVCMLLWLFV